jgi:signal transduction histidine kinase
MIQLEGQINDLNRLINDLRPAALERLGLSGAIEALARESSARSGIEIGTEVEVDECPSRDEERIVYRLVQEALTNVVKHARASHVDLVAREVEGKIRISVCDDGEGFDPDAPGAGRGLKGMRERIELFGGELEVSSAPGEGTEISASVPLGRL